MKPEIHLKVRTWESDDGKKLAVAYIAMDGVLGPEIGTLSLEFLEGPGDPEYHKWVDLMSALLNRDLSKALGVEVKSKRQKPSYKGES